MRILYILKHDPWGIGGGCYASRCYFDAFTTVFKDAEFDVLFCSEFADNIVRHTSSQIRMTAVPSMSNVTKLISPFSRIMNRFHKQAKQMLSVEDYEWCIFDHSSIAGSLVKICKEKGTKTIVLNHNFEYDYYRDSHPQWYKTVATLPVVKWNERQSYKECDFNIFLTKEDVQQFRTVYGTSQTKTIVSGCFLHKGIEPPKAKNIFQNKRLQLVISGTIGNVQNMDGINHFFSELYPKLPSDMDVVIAGKEPPLSLENIIKTMPNVSLIANPIDMWEVVRQCDIFLCPTRLGGGQKLRIMDGLLAGLPVIAHNVSTRGYTSFVQKGFFFEYENADEFAENLQKVTTYLKNSTLQNFHIRQFAIEEFSFESKTKMLQQAIEL